MNVPFELISIATPIVEGKCPLLHYNISVKQPPLQ